ncbi:MAG TPA: PqqD family protein [Acidobacteriota bacterium]|jgi:hypothetical protein|nr:PqqD family protein [Acidobacteriota bacterium]HNT17302.1 PqqD family protein [Acidobacteriota bacterium]HPA26365.1 PqqD family protein [Acidobacteriota bacterium]HQO19739.1 PqqD family protein [Acidobacteriota bacterium]HQQ46347.1 PqqD family protein [Acidobacteriota bacterium]
MNSDLKKNPDVSWQMVEGQAVLIHNRLGEIMVLNEVGSLIWKNIEDGQEKTASLIVQEYEVSEEQARSDMADFLRDLENCGALVPAK